MAMYVKNLTQRINLRLNDEQFNYVISCSESLGISPSEYIRSVIDSLRSSERKVGSLENDKTNINNFL